MDTLWEGETLEAIGGFTFINGHLLKAAEKAILIRTLKEACSKYGVDAEKVPVIEIDPKDNGAGGNFFWHTGEDVGWVRLCYKQYERFGFNNILKIFKHEVAHVIACLRYNATFDCEFDGHTPLWGALCMELGGSMNDMVCKVAGLDMIQCDKYVASKFVFTSKGLDILVVKGDVIAIFDSEGREIK